MLDPPARIRPANDSVIVGSATVVVVVVVSVGVVGVSPSQAAAAAASRTTTTSLVSVRDWRTTPNPARVEPGPDG
jgi:hypothetical protein